MKLALLIDADNIAPSNAEEIFSIANKLGETITRRAFGNISVFSGKDGWKEAVREYAIEARPQVTNLDRKNTADFALIIDAMDCLASGRYDGFVLVSSDSDFTSLAQRLRNDDKAVYGIGDSRALVSFRNACTQFFDVGEKKALTSENTPQCTSSTTSCASDVSCTQAPIAEATPPLLPVVETMCPPPPSAEATPQSPSKLSSPKVTSPVNPSSPQTPKPQSLFLEVVATLRKQKCKKVETLRNWLVKNMKKPAAEAERIIKAMKKQKLISVDEKGKVTWLAK